MTKLEFLLLMPDVIDHPAHGYGELEIIADAKNEKGSQYRHNNKSTSHGNLAGTWEELYNKLRPHLVSNGYIAD